MTSSEIIEDLQSRLAFQEDAIDHLNQAMASQADRIDILQQQIRYLHDQLKQLGERQDGGVDTVLNEIPPHY